MSSGGGGTAGFWYYFGILMGLGRGPVDEVIECRVADKLGWQGSATSAEPFQQFNNPELFGGATKEGGILGPFEVMMGEPGQTMGEPLKFLVSPAVPTGFERMLCVFFDGMIAALNPYPKPWSWRVRRAVKGWDGDAFRPDLAIIDMLGDPFPLPPTPSRPTAIMYETHYVPLVMYSFVTILNMPGYRDVIGVDHVDVAIPIGEGDFQRINNIYFEIEFVGPNEDMKVKVHRTHYGKRIEVYYKYIDAIDGLEYVDMQWWPAGGDNPADPYIPTDTPAHIVIPPMDPDVGEFLQVTSVETFSQGQGVDHVPARGVSWGHGDEVDRDIIITDIDEALLGQPVNVGYFYYPFLPNPNPTPIREIKAMNPSHIIYEALTNREWGRGLDRSVIDTASFEAAAVTLKAEVFGGCGRWARRDSINSFIQGILDYIGAVLYTNRSTALLTLHLIRGDYDRNALKLWDTTNGLMEITDSAVNTSTVVINEVIVKYRDPVFNRDRSVNVQNLASLQSGAFNTKTVEYKFCPTNGLARRLAQRDLRAYAEGLRRYKITVDRRGQKLFPGQVMRIQDAARNIPDTVVRIATMKDGTLQDGKIVLDVVQDVFSMPATSYVSQQPNVWAPTPFTPCVGEHRAFEAPYFLLRRKMSAADFDYVDNGSAYLATVAARGQTINSGYDIAVRDSAPTPDDIPALGDQLYCGYTPS